MVPTLSKRFKLLLILGLTFSCSEEKKPTTVQELWYDKPAEKWIQALPVGNGRLGAMIFGGTTNERIQLNEDSMWPGGPEDWGNSKGTPDDLAKIRQLVEERKLQLADSLYVEKFSFKSVVRSHQTMGDLYIDFKGDRTITDYKRSLNLNKALSTTTYKVNGYAFSQKVFASTPDDVLIVYLESENPEGISFSLKLNRPKDNGKETVTVSNPSNNEISMKGEVTQLGGKKFSEPFPIDYGVKFETLLHVKAPNDKIEAKNGTLTLTNVKSAILYISGKSSYYHTENYVAENKKVIEKALKFNTDELLKRHIEDYQAFYNRVTFNLKEHAQDTLPTNVRLQRTKKGQVDIGLASLLFHYGRYLLISSSRPGANPANLQGLWNEHIKAPWNADYHLNINMQMNYWPANLTNLAELNQPFFHFSDKLIAHGKKNAIEQYGIKRGAVIHHASDFWATTWVRGGKAYWGAWIHGGGWLAQHYFEYYKFTEDNVFLKERAYPFLKEIAAFYADWLVWDENLNGYVSTPESSPENSYIAENGQRAALSYGCAMGHQIIAEVFTNYIETTNILNIEEPLVAEVKEKLAKLLPSVQIGPDGRILEWNKPYDEPEKGHRHMSHLYALHPGTTITESDTLAFLGAQKTIDYRIEYGGAGTGWSRAWMINFNARLLDSVSAQHNIDAFLKKSIAHNLFDEHPPFQIDGNFGYTAGVAELLLQSHEGFLRLLPALPTHWKNGSITGLKARGDIEVDLEWENGALKKVILLSCKEKTIQLKYKQHFKELTLKPNKKMLLNGNVE
ncbi:MAG: glycosyl hydrolase family 95 catalytic domain-containing protein [Aestuariibaculum sp.]